VKHKNSDLLIGYWNLLRNGRNVPDQADIDPRQIKRLLSYIFILDCESPSHPVYRLAGASIYAWLGFEPKGTRYLATWESKSGLFLSMFLRRSLKWNQPVGISSIAATMNNGMVEIESVLMPMRFNGLKTSRFLGLMQTVSDPLPLIGHSIAYQRVINAFLLQDGEKHEPNSSSGYHDPLIMAQPKAAHLRLV
jgi:hypothetical protein